MSHSPAVPVRLCATFTADPLVPVLCHWFDFFGINGSVEMAPYQQLLQQLLDPSSMISTNRGGINVLLVRGKDLAVDSAARGRSAAREVVAALGESIARDGIRTLVVACPSVDASEAEVVFLDELKDQVSEVVGAEYVDGAGASALYQVEYPFDPAAEAAAAIPYTDEMFRALGTSVARRILAGLRKPIKVIAVDADHTLWTGIVGEVGATGVKVGPARKAFQEFLLECRSQGHLLCLVSKNHPDDVEAVFRDHPEMVITRDAFVDTMINWDPKSANLQRIAERLNLGLDSFLFLDDSPVEIAEVAANAPGVTAVRIPEKEEELEAFVRHLWVLDRHSASAEDARRADFYHDEARRRALRDRTSSYEEFIAGLDLRMDIVPLDDQNLSRASQLSRRTNQFNSCPRPRDEAELRESCRGMTARLVEVSDRFGDYGAVGLMIFREDGGRLWAETFLLSCRALGKGVEQRMLRYLGEVAREQRLDEIAIWFSDSGRNQPVREFLERQDGRWEDELRIIASAAARECSLVPLASAKSAGPAAVSEAVTDSEQISEIANHLRTAAAISEWMTEPVRPRPDISERYVSPEGDVEDKIAAIWASVLNLEKVGRKDRFVDLGGNSLQLVRVYSRMQHAFGKAFELVRMFEHPTVEEQAKLIAGKKTTPLEEEVTMNAANEPLAIVGMAVRLPDASTPEELWRNLSNGVESIHRFTAEQDDVPGPADDPAFVRARGMLDPELYEGLDGGLFSILPREAEIIDPQQRVFLELCWEALERGGYRPDDAETDGGRVGIYAGCYYDTYLPHNILSDPELHRRHLSEAQVGALQVEFGNDKDHLATRVAFKLNLKGPSLTVQTACSSSLVAVAHAAMSLRTGQCDMALAGGVTITVPQKRGYHHEEGGMVSRDGHCRPFDADSTGTVFSNGAGVVLIKRLKDAVRDGDHIHAVIRGFGMNNDGGVKHSYAAPSVDGQADAIRRAHRDAGVDPRTITYIEAHGTATPLGDPIEIAGLTAAFRQGTQDKGFCAVGSLKSNLGHLDTAAGVCGLIKTALSLEMGQLPAVLNFQSPNPRIDWANSPFFVNDKLRSWEPAEGAPRRAGVSSFGVGGTNAHLVLEEAPRDATPQAEPQTPRLWLLSGRTATAVDQLGEKLSSFAAGGSTESFAAAARTMALGRKPMTQRLAVVARDWAALAKALGTARPVSVEAAASQPELVWMFPGQGAQHPGMTADLYEAEEGYRGDIDFCADFLKPLLGEDLRDTLFARDGDAAERLKHTVLAQPSIFVVEWALARQWARWGVFPELMVGHSVGEFTAACLAGVFSIEDGLRILAARGELMGGMPGGAMLSVRLAAGKLRLLLPQGIDLAASNGPELSVVAGEREVIARFAEEMEANGVGCRELHTSHAFHSRMMDPVVDRFREVIATVKLHAPKMPILSTVTARRLSDSEAMDPGYWASHLRHTVDFHGAISAAAAEKEGRIFLEVGPGQTLTTLSKQSVGRQAKACLSSCNHPASEAPDHDRLLLAVGELWAHGVNINVARFHADAPKQRVPLPTYPFQRRRAWLECRLLDQAPAVAPAAPAPTLPAAVVAPIVVEAPAAPTASMLDQVRQVLEDLSGIPANEMEPRLSFLELGFDSLLLTQASRQLQKSFGVSVTFRDLMQVHPTLEQLVAHLEKHAAPSAPAPAPVPAASVAPAPSAPVAEATPPAPAASMLDQVREVLEALSGIPVEEMQPRSGFLELGFDSLLLTQASRELQKAFGVPIAFRDLMQSYPTIGQLVDHLEKHASPVAKASEVKTPTAVMAAPVVSPTGVVDQSPEEESGVSGPRTRIDRVRTGDELTPSQRAHLDRLVVEYCERTKTSKSRTQEYRQWHADPRTVNGFNRLYKEMVYQIVATRMKGSRMWDVDGNEYIDMVNGFGPNFLGHAPDYVTEAIQEALATGLEIGPQCEAAMECSKLFSEVTGNERACFLNTGSEAVQAAMRIARTVTGRDKILVFDKDYHGNFDPVLVRSVGKGSRRRTLPLAPGIPDNAVQDVIVVPWGKPAALDMIREVADQLAAVLVEPVQSRQPEMIPVDFVHEVKKIAEENGFLLVFDEVITGIRQGPGGAQALYGIRADLATYGKVFGGGALPIGIIGGKAKYMDTFDGGQWQYGDDSFPEKEVTFFAGTFVRLPLAMAACRAVLRHVQSQPKSYWQDIGTRADRLAGSVDRMFREHGIDVRMVNFNSQMYLRVGEGERHGNLIYYHLRKRGVFAMEGLPFYLTAAHTDADVDFVINAFRETIDELVEAGFFESRALAGPLKTPMTEAQREIFHAVMMGDEANCCYNESDVFHLEGELDERAIESALADLIDRHPSLRSTFSADGENQVFPSEIRGFQLARRDATASPDELLAEWMAEEMAKPFDLISGPLFRATLVKLSEKRHSLILVAHHMVCDGWSFGVIHRELATAYNARRRGLRPVLPETLSFAEYAKSEIENKDSDERKAAEAFWIDQFREGAPVLELPTDRPRPPMRTFPGAVAKIRLGSERLGRLKSSSPKLGGTLFATLFAGFSVLLHRLTGQEDLVVGVPAAGQARIGQDNLIGHCLNFLPVRIKVDRKGSFRDLGAEVRDRVLTAYDHQDYTWGTLVKSLDLPRDPSRPPLVSVMFNLERTSEDSVHLDGLELGIEVNPKRFVAFDLFFNLVQSDDDLLISCEYNTDLHDAGTIQHWLGSFVTLIESFVADGETSIDQLPLVDDEQRRQLFDVWNATQRELPAERTVQEMVRRTMNLVPELVAIRHGSEAVTYADLRSKVVALAGALQHAGVRPGDLVGVHLDRGVPMVVALVALLECGAAYVPMDPDYPAERLAIIAEDAGMKLILSTKSLSGGLPAMGARVLEMEGITEESHPFAPVDPDPNATAYVIFTSGSTGRPKGVRIGQRSFVNYLHSMQREPGMGTQDVLLAVSTLSFDISGFDLFLPLTCGATVVIADRDTTRDGRLLAEALDDFGVTYLQATPATWRLLLDGGWTGKRDLKVLIGGEMVPRDLVNRLAPTCAEVWNFYGPTEATIWSTTGKVGVGEGNVSIGRPVDNTTIHIVNGEGLLQPVGVVGELLIGGAGLAEGYHGRPDLTEERFVELPLEPGGKLYRTGDLARWRMDGTLECLGRMDHQVKVRGFRIELGEIETLLEQHPKVAQAVAHVRDGRLFACLRWNGGPPVAGEEDGIRELRGLLSTRLPDYMIPSVFVPMETFPLTPNGKVDRKALPGGEAGISVEKKREPVAPRTETERVLVDVWNEVMGRSDLGVEDDIFEIGGDSIQIFRIAMAASRKGLQVSPSEIFRKRTIAGLATERAEPAAVGSSPAMIKRADRSAYRREEK